MSSKDIAQGTALCKGGVWLSDYSEKAVVIHVSLNETQKANIKATLSW